MDIELKDGEYYADVTLSGGSGRASVESPALITVEDGSVKAKIVWSSSSYDYMEIDGREYYPLEGEENSTFVIDVEAWDEDIDILAETTAMSEPHMIEYTLRFDPNSIDRQSALPWAIVIPIAAAVLAAAITIVIVSKRKAKHEK